MSAKGSSAPRRGSPLLGDQIQVKIEKMAVGGAGMCRHEGLVVFIPLSAPGDELLVEITLLKKNFAEARILRIIQPGPARRPAPCIYFERCGGCNWQHLSEQEQQKQKENFVFETLKKFLPEQQFSYLPLKASPLSLRYRNRIQPKWDHQRFGFHARESHQIVEIKDCLITEEAITQKFEEAKNWALGKKQTGRMEIYMTPEHEVRYQFTDERQEGFGFSQVNRFQNKDLIDTVLDWTSSEKYRHIHDLYAGSGNFTFPLLEQHQVPMTAVELSAKLVQRGRDLVKTSPIQYVQSDVEKWIKSAHIQTQDLVILDPPRAGCSEAVMKALASRPPRKIIYISCHPVALARDLKWLFQWNKSLQAPLLRLKKVQTFEMFPQTDHVETIAELEVDS